MVDTLNILKRKLFKGEQTEIDSTRRELRKRASGIDAEVNRRVAAVLAQMDPFEPLLKQFHGIFAKEFEHPEDRLDERGRLTLFTWAWQSRDNPGFKWLTEWVMNTQGNETLKHAAVTPERILYGRAQISATALLVNEITRLAAKYDDILAKNKPDVFDETDPLEQS